MNTEQQSTDLKERIEARAEKYADEKLQHSKNDPDYKKLHLYTKLAYAQALEDNHQWENEGYVRIRVETVPDDVRDEETGELIDFSPLVGREFSCLVSNVHAPHEEEGYCFQTELGAIELDAQYITVLSLEPMTTSKPEDMQHASPQSNAPLSGQDFAFKILPVSEREANDYEHAFDPHFTIHDARALLETAYYDFLYDLENKTHSSKLPLSALAEDEKTCMEILELFPDHYGKWTGHEAFIRFEPYNGFVLDITHGGQMVCVSENPKLFPAFRIVKLLIERNYEI